MKGLFTAALYKKFSSGLGECHHCGGFLDVSDCCYNMPEWKAGCGMYIGGKQKVVFTVTCTKCGVTIFIDPFILGAFDSNDEVH